jgi:hypothetical protein
MRPPKTMPAVVLESPIHGEDTRLPWCPVAFGDQAGFLRDASERGDGRLKRRRREAEDLSSGHRENRRRPKRPFVPQLGPNRYLFDLDTARGASPYSLRNQGSLVNRRAREGARCRRNRQMRTAFSLS